MRRTSSPKAPRMIVVGLLSALTIWSCGSSDDERLTVARLTEPCSLNSQCENPLVCTFQRCHEECEEDRDCARGEQRCVKGPDGNVCQLDDETHCERDRDCNGDQVCGVDGECRDECEEDDDCPGGQVCAASKECASTDPTKDVVDDDGNIQPDPFTGEGGAGPGEGGAPGTGGRGGSGGRGGAGGGGRGGSAPTEGGMGGAPSEGGAPGEGGSGGAPVEPGECREGFEDCDSDPSDCETSLKLITSCGGCDVTCDASHGGNVRCDPEALECVITPGACDSGYADCDEDAQTGCEAELATDIANCGQCGRSCGGGDCVMGQCRAAVVVDGVTNSFHTTTNGFLVGDEVLVHRTAPTWETRIASTTPEDPPTQGDVVYRAETGQSLVPESVTFDATYLYFASSTNPSVVYRKPLHGTTALGEVFTAPAQIYQMTSTATAFYYTVYQSSSYDFYVRPKSGSSANAPIPGVADRGASSRLLATSTRLFWLEYISSQYRIVSVELEGGTPVVHDDLGSYNYVAIVTDGDYVYWNQYAAAGAIRRIAADGSGEVETVATALPNQQDWLAVDDEFVYFLASNFNLRRVPKDGSADPTLIATLNGDPYFYNLFGVDDAYLYGVGQQGQILRVSKSPAE